ncbi:hypothetical protein BJ912DRAFT_660873 [Pholiota molesta]|nr:hypothetical protein BJ912DRAFT_660873 [Pholiota molesta]
MYSHNPYAQAGWSNTQSWPSNGQPSVFGALPGHFDVPKEVALGTGPLKFRLEASSTGYPSILNSTLMTPRDKPYLEIVTDKNTTYIRNLSDQTCILSLNGAHRQ